MPKPLTGKALVKYLLDRDDYDVVIRKFNACTHDGEVRSVGGRRVSWVSAPRHKVCRIHCR